MARNSQGNGKRVPLKKKRIKERLRFSIQTKITLPYVILSLFIALGGALLIFQFTLQSIENRFNNSLVETSKISADMMVAEENRMLETLRLIANTDAIDTVVLNQNAEELRELILPIAFNAMEDVVVILDNGGQNLLTIENVTQTDKPVYEATRDNPVFQELEMVKPILQQQTDAFGDKYAGLMILDETPTFFVSGPILDENGSLTGVVMVGTYVENIIRLIRQETLAQITVYDFSGNVLASTLNHQETLSPESAAFSISAQDDASSLRDYDYNDIHYREIVSPWEAREKIDLGLIGVAFSTNFLSDTNVSARRQIAAFIIILLVLTVITGILIGRLITEPIQKLKTAAVNVSDGDLSVHVKSSSHDELAVLVDTFNNMVHNLKASKEELIDAYDRTLIGWTKALELKDRETKGHTQRVTQLTLEMAKRFGYQGDSLEYIKRGAMLHDIGKMGIPDSILKKPAKLTEEEFEIIKLHPQYAYEIMSQISFLHPAIAIPFCHHERWDGTGYPRGIKGEKIPLSARIFAVVDVWDAVTSDRIYHQAMSREQAFELILAESGTHFDPHVVDVFLNYLRENGLDRSEADQA